MTQLNKAQKANVLQMLDTWEEKLHKEIEDLIPKVARLKCVEYEINHIQEVRKALICKEPQVKTLPKSV